MRDLFEHDDGGWLQDPGVLDRLANEKLQAKAEALRRGLEVDRGRSRLSVWAHRRPLPPERRDRRYHRRGAYEPRRLEGRIDRLEEEYAEADEMPDEVDQRLGEIETALAAFEARPVIYDPTEIARAGVFVSIDADGDLRIERGYIRPEDEAPAEPVEGEDGDPRRRPAERCDQRAVITVGGGNYSRSRPRVTRTMASSRCRSASSPS